MRMCGGARIKTVVAVFPVFPIFPGGCRESGCHGDQTSAAAPVSLSSHGIIDSSSGQGRPTTHLSPRHTLRRPPPTTHPHRTSAPSSSSETRSVLPRLTRSEFSLLVSTLHPLPPPPPHPPHLPPIHELLP